MKNIYWPDNYLQKRKTPAQAISLLHQGQRVFIGSSCSEPQALVKALAESCIYKFDLEIVRLLSMETQPLSFKANESDYQSLYIRSFYLGSAKSEDLNLNKKFLVPINLSSIPKLFSSRRLPIHVALVQVSPPDDFGWMSLGISVDVNLAAVQSADFVIAQVNSKMPRVLGRSFVHVNEVNVIVEFDEELLTVEEPFTTETDNLIGKHVCKLIEDGATLQLSLGGTSQAILEALSEKNDLGVHTEFISDGIMHLVSRGVITNHKKVINMAKCVASGAIGSKNLYEFIDDNPGISFFPSDYVNSPFIIAQNNKMISINQASFMDLTGQAAIDAQPFNYFSGVTGTMDFIRGSLLSDKGRSILVLHSTTGDGQYSRIVPQLEDTAVVVPRGDIHYVATEYGIVNLFGKTLEERAMAMISIAHPDFREDLLAKARKTGFVGTSRTLDESIHGVYPLHLEEVRTYNGEKVLFRPAKAVDRRLIKEHFYNLSPNDVISRFFHEKVIFTRHDVSRIYKVDYVKNLTIVAVTGDIGYEKVIAIGGYYLEKDTNMAELAFSTLQEWQKKGICQIIQSKLAEAARLNGISGLVAYVNIKNEGMIKLFNKLPYEVFSQLIDDMFVLKVKFDEPKHPTSFL